MYYDTVVLKAKQYRLLKLLPVLRMHDRAVYWKGFLRYSDGESPVFVRKAAAKRLALLKPEREAMEEIEKSEFFIR